MKEVLAWILGIIVLVAILIGLSFVFGWFGVGYTKTIGKAQINANREVFKESKVYVEGMASDLAKYKYEITTEKDPIAIKAIADLIIEKYGNFDITKLEDISLQNFLRDVRNGKYNMEEK